MTTEIKNLPAEENYLPAYYLSKTQKLQMQVYTAKTVCIMCRKNMEEYNTCTQKMFNV